MNVLTAKCWLALFRFIYIFLRSEMRKEELFVKNSRSPIEVKNSTEYLEKLVELANNVDEVTKDIKTAFRLGEVSND